MTTASQAALSREYETIYILKTAVAGEAAKKVAGRVEEVVKKGGGTLTQVETWGRRPLAYPVKKQKRGVYVYLKYLGGGKVVAELERNLKMLDDVIKFQTIQTRADVDAAELKVDPEAIQFDQVEPPGEDDVDESLEATLGLVEAAPAKPQEPQTAAEPAASAPAEAASAPAEAEKAPAAPDAPGEGQSEVSTPASEESK